MSKCSSFLYVFQNEVKDAVEQLCNILPSNYKADVSTAGSLSLSLHIDVLSFFLQCTSLVDQYFDTIWALVKSELVSNISIPNHPCFDPSKHPISVIFQDNDLICKQIGVCNSTQTLVKFPVLLKPKLSMPKQTACDVCKLAVTFLQQYVDSNSTEVS